MEPQSKAAEQPGTKIRPATALPFSVAESNRLREVARTSHPEEQAGHLDCAAWYEDEINRRANAYQKLVEALRGAIQRSERSAERPQCYEERNLLRDLGESA